MNCHSLEEKRGCKEARGSGKGSVNESTIGQQDRRGADSQGQEIRGKIDRRKVEEVSIVVLVSCFGVVGFAAIRGGDIAKGPTMPSGERRKEGKRTAV